MIKVYDNIFKNVYCSYAWDFVKDSYYKLGWEDDNIFEHRVYSCLHSHYSKDDQDKLGILERLNESEVGSLIKGKNIIKMVANLSVPGQTHFGHVHYDNSVCLYYPALEWRREWGGETMFYTSDNLELERSIEYKPNRLVYFTGEHPHSVRPATYHAPFYRFTVSMLFDS